MKSITVTRLRMYGRGDLIGAKATVAVVDKLKNVIGYVCPKDEFEMIVSDANKWRAYQERMEIIRLEEERRFQQAHDRY